MNTYPRLPDAELEIMAVLWSAATPLTSQRILNLLEERKQWGLTTLLNLLTRLESRGFLAIDKSSRTHKYSPLISREEYAAQEDLYWIRLLHRGSIVDLIANLDSHELISEHELADIRDYINQKEKAKGDIPHWLL